MRRRFCILTVALGVATAAAQTPHPWADWAGRPVDELDAGQRLAVGRWWVDQALSWPGEPDLDGLRAARRWYAAALAAEGLTAEQAAQARAALAAVDRVLGGGAAAEASAEMPAVSAPAPVPAPAPEPAPAPAMHQQPTATGAAVAWVTPDALDEPAEVAAVSAPMSVPIDPLATRVADRLLALHDPATHWEAVPADHHDAMLTTAAACRALWEAGVNPAAEPRFAAALRFVAAHPSRGTLPLCARIALADAMGGHAAAFGLSASADRSTLAAAADEHDRFGPGAWNPVVGTVDLHTALARRALQRPAAIPPWPPAEPASFTRRLAALEWLAAGRPATADPAKRLEAALPGDDPLALALWAWARSGD